MKLTKQTKTFTNQEGKEITFLQFFIVLENGTRIAVKPVYPKTKVVMASIAEREDN